MKRLDIDRLHEIHRKNYTGEHIPPKTGQTELMIQNICSTIEVNKDEEPYTIGVATREYRNWMKNLLPRIAQELEERGIEFEVKNSEIIVSNAKVCLFGENPRNGRTTIEFRDNY